MGPGSEPRMVSRRPVKPLSNWQENVEDISVGLIATNDDDDGNISPSSHAEQVTKSTFLNGTGKMKNAK